MSQVPRLIHGLHYFQKLQVEETVCLNTQKLILHSPCKTEITALVRNKEQQTILPPYKVILTSQNYELYIAKYIWNCTVKLRDLLRSKFLLKNYIHMVQDMGDLLHIILVESSVRFQENLRNHPIEISTENSCWHHNSLYLYFSSSC